MSTPPEKNDGPGTPQNCPWATHPATGEHERLAPPAPMIELDSPVSSEPVKPLGPRRLARLQREMAEHAREIQDAERANRSTGVDDALLAKQQRLADLAVRAAAANQQDRDAAQRALAQSGDAGSPEASGSEASGAAAPGAVVPGTATPRAGAPRGTDPATGALVDAAPDAAATSWPASPVDYGPGPATTQIPIYTAPERRATASAGPGPASDAESPVSQARPSSEGERASTLATSDHDGTRAAAGTSAASGSDADTAPGSTASARTAGENTAGERAPGDAASSSVEDSHHAPPGRPVRAVDAEGLELLEPGAYKSRGGWMRWLLVLLLLVVAALAVVLIMFIL
ncbi:hypothetical protein [Kocuria salsicia]|uniref:hypothetical protein n=1 Tax=Kocuria salsicia TaxID=664639 RepID=UPI0006D78EFF|nr:hypothetical protein [Kocuria salsicia]